jgi:hypothetical protein
VEKGGTLSLPKEKKVELAAIFLMGLWVVAWLASWKSGLEIPGALNITMPMASAILLGVKLPIDVKKGEDH